MAGAFPLFKREGSVGIFWDIQNVPLPGAVDPKRIARNLVSALRQVGMSGGISITGFLPTSEQHERLEAGLGDTGIAVRGLPKGNKEDQGKIISFWIDLWSSHAWPPAHLLFIGDQACFQHMKKLKFGHNVILACPFGTVLSKTQKKVSTMVLDWEKLAGGEVQILTRGEKHVADPSLQPGPSLPPAPAKALPLRNLKSKLRRVLLRIGNKGVLLSELKRVMEADGEPFDVKTLGFGTLKSFLTSIPEIAMLKNEDTKAPFVVLNRGPEAVVKKRKRAGEGEEGAGGASVAASAGNSCKSDPPKSGPSALKKAAPVPLRVLRDRLRIFLREREPGGILLSDLKAAMEADGQPFDYKALGFGRLIKCLRVMPDVAEIRQTGVEGQNGEWVFLSADAKKKKKKGRAGVQVKLKKERRILAKKSGKAVFVGKGKAGDPDVKKEGEGGPEASIEGGEEELPAGDSGSAPKEGEDSLGSKGGDEAMQEAPQEKAPNASPAPLARSTTFAEAKEELRKRLTEKPEGIVLGHLNVEFRHLGFKKLVQFLRAAPDVAELRPEGLSSQRVFLAKGKTEEGENEKKRARGAEDPTQLLQNAKDGLQKVLAKNKQGLALSKIQSMVEREGTPCDFTTFGFSTVRPFVESMPDIAEIREVARNRYRVFAAQETKEPVPSSKLQMLPDLNESARMEEGEQPNARSAMVTALEPTAGEGEDTLAGQECDSSLVCPPMPGVEPPAGRMHTPAGQQGASSAECPVEPTAAAGAELASKGASSAQSLGSGDGKAPAGGVDGLVGEVDASSAMPPPAEPMDVEATA